MKKIIGTLALLILMISTVSAVDWRLSHQYLGQSLVDVFMLDETLGWTVGSGGQIYKTTDGGMTWTQKVSPVTGSIYGVYFVDAMNGFAGSTTQILLKTVDGGETWTSSMIADASGTIKGVYFSDINNGHVVVSNTAGGQVFKTADGGATWTKTLQSDKDLLAMSFASPQKGVVTGKDVGHLYYTTDGTTWTLAPTPALGGFNYTRSDIWGVQMVNENIVYATGWGSSAAGLQPSIHLKSTNGGAIWEYQTIPENQRTYVNFEDVYFRNELEGFSVGGSSAYYGSVISKTVDGGVNWNVVSVPFGFPVGGITGKGDKLWVVGDGGCIGYSSDFGTTWTMVTNAPAAFLYSVKFASEDIIFSGGFGGAYIRSTDRGNTWKGGFVVVDGVTPKIANVHFVNQNIGYMARSYNQVCKTTDGGATWFAVVKDSNTTNLAFNGLYFLDENTGYVVGKVEQQLIKTTDGGATWVALTPNAGVELLDVHFTDVNNGVITGKSRKVMYTTDAGATWIASTLNNIPAGAPTTASLTDVHFVSPTVGYIAGVLNFKTNDGGKTWDYFAIPDPTKTMNSVANFGENRIVISGADQIYESNDGGLTWLDIKDPNVVTSTSLYGANYDPSGYIYLTSSLSSIYTTSPIVSVENEVLGANAFNLSQNYPNPFNPSTVINYSLANEGFVNLSVYNLLGEKVSEIVNTRQNKGSYTINFDATNLSSGVYFYSLKVDDLNLTKKMILIR